MACSIDRGCAVQKNLNDKITQKAPLTGALDCGNQIMKLFTESNFARASALVSVLVLGALGPQTLHSSTPSVDAIRHLLIQGSNVETLVALVESTGGTVSQELSVLRAVAVEVTPSQLELISRSSDVHRILDDRKAASVDLAGNFWQIDGIQVVGNFWQTDGIQVVGNFWQTDGIQVVGNFWQTDDILVAENYSNLA
jgi:hypothetical protein